MPVVASTAVTRSAFEVDPARLLKERRASIDALYERIEALGPAADPSEVAGLLAEGLAEPSLAFLSSLEGGQQRLIDQSVVEYGRFVPSVASNAATAAGLVRILLLQNVDLVWWDHDDDLLADADAVNAPDYLDLVAERRHGSVRFSFGVASDGIVRRGRDFLVQRLFPGHEPRGPGLSFTCIRPAMLGVLNEVADQVGQLAPRGTPPIRVNSIVRSVEHQRRLRALGFSALLPSAHCRGWAADIEVTWFERFAADDVLRDVLLDYLDRGVLNVIDEGRAWHICLAPDFVDHYAARAGR